MTNNDIITLILHELNLGQNYGLDLIKNIYNKSNGQIEIKQANLYTVLKKLEKTRLISSFWVDSDIGGKRHYYKLTDLGRTQLDSYPSYEDTIAQILDDLKGDSDSFIAKDYDSITDNTLSYSAHTTEPLTTEETRSEDKASEDKKIELTADETNINVANSDSSKLPNSTIPNNSKNIEPLANQVNTQINNNDEFEESIKKVFDNTHSSAEKVVGAIKNERKTPIKDYTPPKNEFLRANFQEEELKRIANVKTQKSQVSYKDFINYKTDANYLGAKKMSNKLLTIRLTICLVLLLQSTLYLVLALNFKANSLASIIIISSLIISVLLIPITFLRKKKNCLKFFKQLYKFKFIKNLIFRISVIVILILCILCLNLFLWSSTNLISVLFPSNLVLTMIISPIAIHFLIEPKL